MFGKYRKTVIAVVGAVITWASAVVASPPDAISAGEWLFGGIALAIALGVYGVPNEGMVDVDELRKLAAHQPLTDDDPGD